jgi:hypothetical protein
MSLSPFRYISSWLDNALLHGGRIVGPNRAFAGTRRAEPPKFNELIREMEEAPPEVQWQRARKVLFWERVPTSLPSFNYQSYLDLHRAPGDRADTLVIYHHGLGEIPHDILPNFMFRHPGLRRRCDWIAIKGIHHRTWNEVSGRLLRDRNIFIRSLVASAALCKKIATDIGKNYKHVVMAGTSMGGIISMIESIHDPQFQLYVPFIAGPNLADVMLKSDFRCMIHSAFRRREQRAPWLHELDMTWRLEERSGPPIRPLLARSDRLFRYEKQMESYSRIEHAEVSSFEGGHLTGAINVVAFARHLHAAVDQHCWQKSGKSSEKAQTKLSRSA